MILKPSSVYWHPAASDPPGQQYEYGVVPWKMPLTQTEPLSQHVGGVPPLPPQQDCPVAQQVPFPQLRLQHGPPSCCNCLCNRANLYNTQLIGKGQELQMRSHRRLWPCRRSRCCSCHTHCSPSADVRLFALFAGCCEHFLQAPA